MSEKQTSFLTYKGKPLVRNGDTIYYGNMSDSHIIVFSILSSREVNGVSIADKVGIYLTKTDPTLNPIEATVKSAEKNGLWAALDIATVWLNQALSK